MEKERDRDSKSSREIDDLKISRYRQNPLVHFFSLEFLFFFPPPRNLPRFRTSEKRVLMQNDPAFDYWTVPICSVSVVASVVACIRNQKVPSEFWRVLSMFRFVTLR